MKTVFRPHSALILALAIASCSPAGPTGYGPAIGLYGYSHDELENGTWRIVFTGNAKTPRNLVESYALYRAAEFSLERGAPTFMLLHKGYGRQLERGYADGPPPTRYVGEMDRHGAVMHEGEFDDRRLTTTERRRAAVTILPLTGQPVRPGFPVENAAVLMRRLEPVVKHRSGKTR